MRRIAVAPSIETGRTCNRPEFLPALTATDGPRESGLSASQSGIRRLRHHHMSWNQPRIICKWPLVAEISHSGRKRRMHGIQHQVPLGRHQHRRHFEAQLCIELSGTEALARRHAVRFAPVRGQSGTGTEIDERSKIVRQLYAQHAQRRHIIDVANMNQIFKRAERSRGTTVDGALAGGIPASSGVRHPRR